MFLHDLLPFISEVEDFQGEDLLGSADEFGLGKLPLPPLPPKPPVPHTTYFLKSNTIHAKLQFWTQVYMLTIFSLIMVYLVVSKHRQPALIIATSCLMVHGGLTVMYGYALKSDPDLQNWFRDHKMFNDIVCMICHLGYGIGYYILLIRPWMMSI
jgi:hypothetical protein